MKAKRGNDKLSSTWRKVASTLTFSTNEFGLTLHYTSGATVFRVKLERKFLRKKASPCFRAEFV